MKPDTGNQAARPIIDFDHHAPEHVLTSTETYAEMRGRCPVFWSPRYGGFWGLTRYADALRMSKDKGIFSSRKTFGPSGEAQGGVSIPPMSHFHLVPTETDDPEWRRYRLALGPLFTPDAVALRKDKAFAYTTELIDHHIESGKMDLVLDLANPLPAILTLEIIGLPLDQWHKYAMPWHMSAYAPPGSEDAAYAERGIRWMSMQLARMIQEVRAQGGADNLVGALVCSDGSGTPFSDAEILNMLIQVVAGGVDTTTALTANALLYMHQHHDTRQQLAENPQLMPTAIEEFMRYVTPIQNLGRTITQDTDLEGHQANAGERAMFILASANRDAAEFERADEVILDRFPNRHVAWGLGTHRCLGSSLARLMFSTMVGELLKRIPDYVVDEKHTEHYPTMSTVKSYIRMPASFTPGHKLGTGIPLPRFDSSQRHDYEL